MEEIHSNCALISFALIYIQKELCADVAYNLAFNTFQLNSTKTDE